jgi:CRISPR-associated endonuclease/helicase Cas3
MTFLAHSARPNRGIGEQSYAEHIGNVVDIAQSNVDRAARYSQTYGELLRIAVRQAAEYHDLGKLDDSNQEVLRANRGKMFNHVDAGVAHLLDGPPSVARTIAALAAFAHHIGLPNIADEAAKGARKVFRDCEPTTNGQPLREITDQRLADYRQRHNACRPNSGPSVFGGIQHPAPPMILRMALSCLVDADHSDTARNYGDPVVDQKPPELLADSRLQHLDKYVSELGKNRVDERSRLRATVYHQCRDADFSSGMAACDSPVGSGKTTAVMAHLLRAAAAKKLRRVFVVLPFTNIIDQSVEVYRKSLVLSEETAEDVVVAHHHKTEFDDLAARQYSFLWHAPIVVTTAVQFFETLAARSPSSVRKLHQVAGSAIFIDEAHAALPAHLWPQAWLWLRELERDWNCHIVLGSGSLQHFWEHEEFVNPKTTLPQIVTTKVRDNSAEHERRRVKYRSQSDPLDLSGLAEFVKKTDGPRLLIVNTVQSAAAIARHLANKFGGEHVEHLSTALTPSDRQATLDLVKLRLRQPNHRDWTLVATSCVEAGVDISFRTGIRERCSLTSLLQTSGRVNRSNEYEQADVWDIQLRNDHLLRPHPAFEASSRVLAELFAEHKVSPDFCTEALRREIIQEGMPKKKRDIAIAERNADFPTVEKLFRVIDSDTVTAIVDEAIVNRLEGYEKISRAELQSASVQIWHSKAQAFGLERLDRIQGYEDLRVWKLPYDRFLGVMAGVLPLIDGGNEGFII